MRMIILFFAIIFSTTALAQQVGSKAIFKSVDGTYFTGSIPRSP